MTRVTNREGEKAAETETTRLEGGKNHIIFFLALFPFTLTKRCYTYDCIQKQLKWQII